MNLETISNLVELCPVHPCIQQLIFIMLIGYGTPTAHAIRTAPLIGETPSHVVRTGTQNRCRHTFYYNEKTITHCYDKSSHFSRETLYELHKIYLTNKQQTLYTISRLRDLNQDSVALSRNRLIRMGNEELRLK
jgi:hypothetical protein